MEGLSLQEQLQASKQVGAAQSRPVLTRLLAAAQAYAPRLHVLQANTTSTNHWPQQHAAAAAMQAEAAYLAKG